MAGINLSRPSKTDRNTADHQFMKAGCTGIVPSSPDRRRQFVLGYGDADRAKDRVGSGASCLKTRTTTIPKDEFTGMHENF